MKAGSRTARVGTRSRAIRHCTSKQGAKPGEMDRTLLVGCGLKPRVTSTMKERSRSEARERVEARNARRIRVLHLIDSLELGGAQTALLAWLTSHDRSRFEVHLASMHGTRKSLFYKRAEQLGIPVIFLSPRRLVPIYLFRLPLLMLRRRYDVAHCHLFASNWLGKPFRPISRCACRYFP